MRPSLLPVLVSRVYLKSYTRLHLQRPFRKSLKHHLLSSYYASLFAVVSSQLRARKRHDDGVQGLLELLRDVPIMRVALKEHAEANDASLAKRLSRLGDMIHGSDGGEGAVGTACARASHSEATAVAPTAGLATAAEQAQCTVTDGSVPHGSVLVDVRSKE